MKKIYFKILFIIGLAIFISLTLQQKTSAASFSPGNIIDDGVFENTGTMNAAQIDNFLNSFSGSCISSNHGFTTPDPQGWSDVQNTYLYGGNVTAGTAIAHAAQLYHVNPQVIMATMQKEQSLVSGGAGCYPNSPDPASATPMANQCGSGTRNCTLACTHSGGCVNIAMGYGCPNYCDSRYEGFSKQLTLGTWVLRFGQQRAYGRLTGYVGYETGDETFTYTGPMTAGVRKRCASCAAISYDGTTTISNTTFIVANGSTATLYNFTPFISGNQNFYNIFTSWFGSTTYLEPISGLLESGNQTGRLYFISLDNNTRYYIPTWSTFLAYGFNRYQIIPTDDVIINGYTDGGTLKTLVFNNNDQKVYLVDGGWKFWFQNYCANWGLDCLNNTPGDVTFMTSSYFDNFISYGGLGQPVQLSGGVYYLMNNGTKSPFVDRGTMQALGYSTNQVINIQEPDLNSSQPFGPLQIFYQTLIQFNNSPQLLYFDGSAFHHITSWDIVTAWGLQKQPILKPPASSSDTSNPTLGPDLGIWQQLNGHKFLVDSGRKIDITSNTSTWYSGSFQTFGGQILSYIPTTNGNPTSNASINGGIYVMQSGSKRHVATYDDYLWLGINSGNTLGLSAYTGSQLPDGIDIVRDGAPFTVAGNPGLYVTNSNGSYHIPSADMFNDFGFKWGLIRMNMNPNVLSSGYPSSGELTRWVKPGNTGLAYVSNQTVVNINATSAANWGIDTNSHPADSVDLAMLFGLNTSTLGQIVRNKADGGLYYGSGGSYHYIASYSKFVSLGGLQSLVTDVSPDFFTGLTQGSALN